MKKNKLLSDQFNREKALKDFNKAYRNHLSNGEDLSTVAAIVVGGALLAGVGFAGHKLLDSLEKRAAAETTPVVQENVVPEVTLPETLEDASALTR